MSPTLLRHVYHDQPRMLPPPFLFPNIISFFELPPQPWIIIVVIHHPHTSYSHHFSSPGLIVSSPLDPRVPLLYSKLGLVCCILSYPSVPPPGPLLL